MLVLIARSLLCGPNVPCARLWQLVDQTAIEVIDQGLPAVEILRVVLERVVLKVCVEETR